MTHRHEGVIIVGGGVAGLACARRLHRMGVGFTILDAAERLGGRIKTDAKGGFLLDHGFQVLQTAYPEARRMLDYDRLDLRAFAPGAMIRVQGRFHTVADPLRRPQHLLQTVTAPIGTLADRLRLAQLARRATRGSLEALMRQPEQPAMRFLRDVGFSDTMIQRFFVPFFGGVCLDRRIPASSRVLLYVLRMFAAGDAALPAHGMEQIPRQLAADLPAESVRTGVGVRAVDDGKVILEDGTPLAARAVVVATDGPSARRLLGQPAAGRSVAETCLYFTAPKAAWHSPFLLLNGDGTGPINNIAVPSRVSPAYAPDGESLFSVVVLADLDEGNSALAGRVKTQLVEWFGPEAETWNHLATYRIPHALPDQTPPTSDPGRSAAHIGPGLFVCGEHGSLPGIQWALLSGRHAADAVGAYLADRR